MASSSSAGQGKENEVPRNGKEVDPAPPRFGTVNKQVSKKRPLNALELGPRKRPAQQDPLVHHGRHFGRTICAFSNVHSLLLLGLSEKDIVPETQQERREHRVYRKLLKLVPGLEERLLEANGDDDGAIFDIATHKGAASARSDDTKSLKSAVIDWITPSDGEPLRPPLARNVKVDRGIKEQLRNKTMAIPGNHWPLFVYRDEEWHDDPLKAWTGLFRSKLLVYAYKHVFTSPSSVDDDPKSTRSGNARIHGMTCVTPASVAYITTQLRFALSSASIFSRTDKETDSETFYTSVLELFEDPEEQDEVKALMAWWNRQVFPSFSNVPRTIPTNSVLSKIKERRAVLKARALNERGDD
ncbi:hypothetical protein DFP72DRAFT_851379 [Ephemerocybe angulata]|uniref:Uncharacterized protein n=1 Tax=Ephemerocybe angulata TaxID=980116 RepID=A0A8H6HQJ7_9AGAR|nr:hypothetical protein DFP72DRAFT_851379 [Tulosesus angulatus]